MECRRAPMIYSVSKYRIMKNLLWVNCQLLMNNTFKDLRHCWKNSIDQLCNSKYDLPEHLDATNILFIDANNNFFFIWSEQQLLVNYSMWFSRINGLRPEYWVDFENGRFLPLDCVFFFSVRSEDAIIALLIIRCTFESEDRNDSVLLSLRRIDSILVFWLLSSNYLWTKRKVCSNWIGSFRPSPSYLLT